MVAGSISRGSRIMLIPFLAGFDSEKSSSTDFDLRKSMLSRSGVPINSIDGITISAALVRRLAGAALSVAGASGSAIQMPTNEKLSAKRNKSG